MGVLKTTLELFVLNNYKMYNDEVLDIPRGLEKKNQTIPLIKHNTNTNATGIRNIINREY